MPELPTVLLRQALDGDEEFLHRVYASNRAQELAQVPWSDAQKDAFLRMQTHAQRQHYAAAYPGSHYQVMEVEGVPVGRLLLSLESQRVHVVDVGVLPEFQNRGVATKVLLGLQELAATRGQPLTMSTELHNPARRLYARLGFRVQEERDTHVLLEWRA